jgi:hypothetical protein
MAPGVRRRLCGADLLAKGGTFEGSGAKGVGVEPTGSLHPQGFSSATAAVAASAE